MSASISLSMTRRWRPRSRIIEMRGSLGGEWCHHRCVLAHAQMDGRAPDAERSKPECAEMRRSKRGRWDRSQHHFGLQPPPCPLGGGGVVAAGRRGVRARRDRLLAPRTCAGPFAPVARSRIREVWAHERMHFFMRMGRRMWACAPRPCLCVFMCFGACASILACAWAERAPPRALP